MPESICERGHRQSATNPDELDVWESDHYQKNRKKGEEHLCKTFTRYGDDGAFLGTNYYAQGRRIKRLSQPLLPENNGRIPDTEAMKILRDIFNS